MDTCRTCELIARRDAGEAPPWDVIARTANWDLVHASHVGIEGWLLLVARRHVTSVADLTDEEAAEFGPLVREVSRALRETVGCPRTYVVQFSEHSEHRHVHVHVIPRAPGLPDDQWGTGIFVHLGVPEDRRVSEPRMNDLAMTLRGHIRM